MGKRRRAHDDDDEIRREIRRLQEKIENRAKKKKKNYIIYSSDEDSDASNGSRQSNDIRSSRSRSRKTSSADTAQGSSSGVRRDQPKTTQGPTPGPSSAPDPPGSGPDDSQEKSLDDDILCLLGDAPTPETKFGENVHKDIASRWQEILNKGLPKETKEKLLKEYLVPANCDFLVPPALNPETKAALGEPMIKRDYALFEKQRQIGVALAALAQATELLVSKETSVQKILKPLSDASRILCDVHFTETKTRRNFVISAVKPEIKETLVQSARTNFLFGDNVGEKLKAATTIQKSGENLRPLLQQNKSKFHKSNFVNRDNFRTRLNSKALHPKAGKTDAGRGRFAMNRPRPYGTTHRRSPNDRSPSPRRLRTRPTTRSRRDY